MSSQETTARISRSVPLDQLEQPTTDVREHRPEDDVASLAASMGDPSVGQLQDVLVHPVDPEDAVEDATAAELDGLFRDDHPMRVVDGETRRLAAHRLGWATLDCTILPRPPENTVVAQLDANSERIDMTNAETARALYQYREDTGKTLADIGDEVGLSPSYLSRVFSLCEAPDWLQGPWRNPDHPLDTSHAMSVRQLVGDNVVQEYADAGGFDEERAYERAREDARLMIDVQQKHDLQVGEFRERCRRKRKTTRNALKDQTTAAEKRAQGQAQSAEAQHTPAETPEISDCTCCGSDRPNRRKFALNVCDSCYGMLSSAEANGEVLAVADDVGSTPRGMPPQEHIDREDAAMALAAVSPLTPQEAAQGIESLLGQIEEQPVEPSE